MERLITFGVWRIVLILSLVKDSQLFNQKAVPCEKEKPRIASGPLWCFLGTYYLSSATFPSVFIRKKLRKRNGKFIIFFQKYKEIIWILFQAR